MAAAARKKALMLSLTLATFSVDKKVPERHKYGLMTGAFLRSRRRMIFNIQRSTTQSRLLLKESSLVCWSAIVGRVFGRGMFRKY